MPANQLQYELWRECNSHCTYCTLGNDNNFTAEKLKLEAMQTAINEIKTLKPGLHDALGFIGGEFFQGQLNTQQVKNKFMELMKVSKDALKNKIVNQVWINASLLIGNQKDLYEALDIFEHLDGVWVLTSYDSFGRFHSQKMLENWEFHLKKIHEEYPEIRTNITTILTGDFVKKYISHEIDLQLFCDKYKSTLYLKSPVLPAHLMNFSKQEINNRIGYFFPKRKDFLTFLLSFLNREGKESYENLMSMELKAYEVRKNENSEIGERNLKFIRDKDTLREFFINETGEEVEEPDVCKKGHANIYQSYCDSDGCMLCDKLNILNV